MGKRAQIIVVDDDELVLELAAVVLEEAGHSVICAVDGEDALDHLDDVDVDLVVTDKAMPRMDGLELCRAIRRDPRLAALPVLMLTAATEPADVLSGLEAGASSYLEKPVDAERLVQRVRALLEPAAVLQMDSSPNVVSHLVASLEERAMDRERFREQSRVHSSWRRSLEDVDAALDALKVQVAILDERGNIVRANAAWLDHATEHGLLDAGWGLGGALGAALVEGAVHSEHRRLARALRDVVSRDLDERVLDAVRCSLGPWTFCRIEVRRFVAAAGLRLLVTREDASARVIALRGSRLRLTLKQLFLDDPPLFVGLGRTPRALASALGWEAAEIWRRHPTGWARERDGYRGPEWQRPAGLSEAIAETLDDCMSSQHVADEPWRFSYEGTTGLALLIDDDSEQKAALVMCGDKGHSTEAVTAALIEDVNGELSVFAARCAARRATSRRRERLAMKKEREQEALLATIIRSVGEGIVVADGEGELLLVNEAAKELLDQRRLENGDVRSADEGASLRHVSCLSGGAAAALGRALRGEHADHVEMVVEHREREEPTYLRVSARPLHSATGNVTGAVAVLRDWTELKRHDEAMKAKNEELAASRRREALGRLAGSVAHEFNNLLTAIVSFSSFLVNDLEPGTACQRDAESALAAARRAAQVTRQLLAFSREHPVRLRDVDLIDTLNNIEHILCTLLGDGVRLIIDAAPESCWVAADPGDLELVFVNLAINARDAMADTGDLLIRCDAPTVREGERWVDVHVSDTGCGMDEETQARVFQPFFTTKPNGTGLGLATVARVVDQCGGDLGVTSAPGRGTTFTLSFRVVEERARQAPLIAQPTAPVSERLAGGRVLLVDDDLDVRRAIGRSLRRLGLSVTEAANPGEALLLAEQQGGFDICITDVMMPLMSGPEFVSRLRQSELPCAAMPVVFISGFADPDMVAELDDDARLLRKPFSPAELASEIHSVLGAQFTTH